MELENMANDHNQLNSANQAEVAVVLVPFTSQGHLNQFLHLSRLISTYNMPIHFVGTTTHGCQAKLRIHGWDARSNPNIHFHEIETPISQSQPHDPTTLPSPLFRKTLNVTLATLHLREPVAKLLRTLSSTAKRIVVIHDSLMTYVVQDVVSLPNAEAYLFRAPSIFFLFWFYWENLGRPFQLEPEILNHVPSLEGCFSPQFMKFLNLHGSHQNFHSGTLYSSSRVVEGKYLDLFAREEISGKTKHWAIGPFNPVEIINSNNRHKCLEWLDMQEENSVIYVSFGTAPSLCEEEIHELAIGLEKSEQKFLWILRGVDEGSVIEGEAGGMELPKGYEETVKEKGIIVKDWAPQMEILGHPSTGGFLTHCGWNSCMESITMGVPMATWPIHVDQPGNAALITSVLKIGLVVKDWAHRGELVKSSVIETVIRRLMSTEEGRELRKRVKELAEDVKRSVAEGGLVHMEFESFISHISRKVQVSEPGVSEP